jgi:acetyl esterase/lipase
MSCESWDSNSKYDVLSKPIQGGLLDPITCYLGEHMEKYLTHPYASPLFGNFSGLPPMLIQAGDAEVLRDEITLLAYKASLAGVKVRHELYEDAVSLGSYSQPPSRFFSRQLFFFSLHRCTYSKPSHFWRSLAGRSCRVANL